MLTSVDFTQFSNLSFDEETHTYYIDNQILKKSVSSIINLYHPHFDKETVAEKYAQKKGLSTEEVLCMWKQSADEACKLGTKVHSFGERYAFDRSLTPSDGFEQAIVKYWDKKPEHIKVACTELKMYHFDYLFPGTADIVLYNERTGKYMIHDYKTNKDLFKNFAGQKLLYPFNNLLDQPINKYQLQLSLYQILLEQIPGVSVESRTIVWLKPDGNYEMYACQDFTDILKQELKTRIYEL